MKELFNDGWLFAKTYEDGENWDCNYLPVQIPHDWLIYDANALYETSFGRYIKKYDFGSVKDKRIRLYFEGVYMNCTVYVNRQPAFDWKYGYSSFEADITDFLHDGENEIAVLVRHESPNTRWYSGAGIFRNVYLITTGRSCIVTDGLYFSASRFGSGFRCTLTAETIESEGCSAEIILSGNDSFHSITKFPVDKGIESNFILEDVTSGDIWDIDHPNLFDMTVRLLKDDEEIDSIKTRVGLRTIEFDSDKGFFLNGRHIKLNGVCLHHDLGCLGAAFNKEAARRQLKTMKEMGVNAVRTSHNMAAADFLDLCDEMGILVDDEAFDMWRKPKTEFDYARFFEDWFERDVTSWVRRDRCHPCIIMWSMGNEIYDTHIDPEAPKIAEALHNTVKRWDPLGNAYTTIGSNYMPWEGAQNCAEKVELVGYNYGEKLYREHHGTHPEWKIYGSETTSGVKSRGVYHFPRSCAFLTHEDLQCSSLGNCKAGVSAETAQDVIAADRDCELSAGMFIWTGSDYIGEPSPYSTKNSYYGSIDTAGLKKDSFYLYKAAWTDEPVLHILPYWDFNEGQLIDVVVYTNLDEVELFVNGSSAGKKQVTEYTAVWQVRYEKGEIKAVGVTADGREISDSEHSFGDSAEIVLEADKQTVKADGEDMFFVTVSTRDKDGYPVRNARDRINITVSGGRLAGFDNGDSTDFDSYKSTSRRLFSGKAAAYIFAPTEAGTVTVTAGGEGLKPSSITVEAVPAEIRKGVSAAENVTAAETVTEIPLRKIELKRSTGALLTPDSPVSEITAELFPKNASYTDITWSVTTNSGIGSKLAEVTAEGLKATVKPLGDGSFRLRASSRNGREQPAVLSEFEYTAEGFGQPFIDPYNFVRGCMYTDSMGIMDEVREGGIGIKADKNIVGYGKVDFGKYGSDSFYARIINWHSNAPFGFRLWSGKPDSEGSELLGSYTYQADFIWQTYINNDYTLEKPICGVHDLYFEFEKTDKRIDMGGFEFIPKLKAYQKINAAECDVIHGDTYTTENGSVKNIGNNVFLDFENMEFRFGTKSISVTGRTRHDNDSVHIRIVTDSADVTEILEFPYSDQPITVKKELPDIHGSGTVKFIFLPGCDFDFDCFVIEQKT